MLCEGSPLLFYTPWGPVTPMGMYRGARRLSQRTGDGPARVTYSFCPRLSRPVYGSLPRQSSSVFGSWTRQSSPVCGSWPRQSSSVFGFPGPILFLRPSGAREAVSPYGTCRRPLKFHLQFSSVDALPKAVIGQVLVFLEG